MAGDLPERFGPYKVEERLGAGGMGEVYRARDTRLGREVAIKVIAREKANNAALLARFDREARAASALSHPNIVGVYDIGEQDGAPYIVSEFVRGESLRQIVSRGPLPYNQFMRIAAQIADALAAAHAAGIVHRDLKPENIMVTPEGRAKILDFGLARRTLQAVSNSDSTVTLMNITLPGTVLGTAGYMSPEQILGTPVDHRSDIFSAGVVLYEMASGERAFQRRTSIEVMSSVIKDDPPRLEGKIVPALERIIRRCIEKDAGKRFQSASELSAALESPNAAPVPSLKSRPRWTGWAAAAVAVIAAGVYWRLERKPPSLQATVSTAVSASESSAPVGKPAGIPVPPAVPPVPQAAAEKAAPLPTGDVNRAGPETTDAAQVLSYVRRYPASKDAAYQQAFGDGILLLSQRKWAAAVDRLNLAIQLKPDSAAAYLGRCRAEAAQDQYQQAITDCSEAIHYNPDSADAYHERGNSYLLTDQFERAIDDMNVAIRMGDSNLDQAHSIRGRAHSAMNEWGDAIQDFNEAIRLNPNVGQFFMFRGVAYNGRSEFRKAIGDFNEALRLQPNLAVAYSYRAEAKQGLGDVGGAAADRKQAADLKQAQEMSR
jgi:serine/threonine protein kinase/Flp pilus assembly protein TadD